jgi:DNA polymerase III subunit epsilon
MRWWRPWKRGRDSSPDGTGRSDAAAADPRWVVVDVEASGLDPGADRLLAIAGIAVLFRNGVPLLSVADSFEVILRQEPLVDGDDAAIDKSNILLHGIGVGAQQGGVPADEAMAAFRTWVADAPIVGYHAAFDQTLIQRYCLRHLDRRLGSGWADLEHVVQLVVPGLPDRSLDAAMARLGVTCLRRHQAVADSLATAEVLLKVWPLARAQMGRHADFKAFRRLAARHHWLHRESG